MNVLHYGLILSQPYDITRGLREVGVNADCAIWDDYGESWLIKGCDVNLQMTSIGGMLKWVKQRAKMSKFILDVIKDYDIIHFHSHPTLWRMNYLLSTYKDTKLFKAIGKKMFLSVWGCEIRNWKYDIQYRWSPCHNCGVYRRSFCNITRNKILAASQEYCNTTFATGDICVEHPHMVWSNLAVDTVELNPDAITEIPDAYKIHREEDEVVIYHAFGNSSKRPDVKGSGYINTAIQNLQKEGYKIKYLFVDRVPIKDVKYIQYQADIVIDQLCAGWYGSNATECMSLSKPVIAYLRDDVLEACPNEDIPIINANPLTIENILRDLINNRERISGIGKRSREYAVKYHDRKSVAKEFLKYYEA